MKRRHAEWLRRLSAGLTVLLCAAIAVSPSRPGYHAGSGVYAHPPYLGFAHRLYVRKCPADPASRTAQFSK